MKRKLIWAVGSLVLLVVLFGLAESDLLGSMVTACVGDSMDWHARWMAGWHGIDCGRVKVHGDPTAATNCALKAQAEGKPFRVVYNIMGFDASVAGGIVRTPDGVFYGLSFDGDPYGGGGTSLLAQRVSIKSCPKPTHLWVNPKGRINCFQQQLSYPRSLMSPNFEPY